MAGIPTEYNLLIINLSGTMYDIFIFTGIGLTQYIIMYTAIETNCPSTFAIAAPLIPIVGNGPMPNIIKGSSTMLVTNPHIILNIETFILPTA